MTLLDANVLLYAYDDKVAHHKSVRRWLENLLSGRESVGLPWLSAWAFIRISTNPRLSDHPLSTEDALAIVDELRSNQLVTMINPGRRHHELLSSQMHKTRIRGVETTDAVLAALAIENGARLASTDEGFRRFRDLEWVNPIQA